MTEINEQSATFSYLILDMEILKGMFIDLNTKQEMSSM